MDNKDDIKPQEPSPIPNALPSRWNRPGVLMVAAGIVVFLLIIAVGVGIYLLKAKSVTQQSTPSATPSAKKDESLTIVAGKETFGQVNFTVPKDWQVKRVSLSGGGETLIVKSPQAIQSPPGGFGPSAGIEFSASKTSTNDTGIKCNPGEVLNDAESKVYTTDIECTQIDGKLASKSHSDYEAHTLSYNLIHKGNHYSFVFWSKDLAEERKYNNERESIIKSIKFL